MLEDAHFLCRTGVGFFGTITAGVTHDINNVLSIINECSGLLEDLAYLAEQGTPVKPEKLTQLSQQTSKQVARGVNIIKSLNRFAHSVDAVNVPFDAHTFLKDLVHFSQRFADRKRVELVPGFPEKSPKLVGKYFHLLHASFICVRLAVDFPSEEKKIAVACDWSGGLLKVAVSGMVLPKDDPLVVSQCTLVSILVEEMAGQWQSRMEEGMEQFALAVPMIEG